MAYTENTDGRLWWCNSHRRRANYVTFHEHGDKKWHHCCGPLPGILLPCDCIDLTDDVEIEQTDAQNDQRLVNRKKEMEKLNGIMRSYYQDRCEMTDKCLNGIVHILSADKLDDDEKLTRIRLVLIECFGGYR